MNKPLFNRDLDEQPEAEVRCHICSCVVAAQSVEAARRNAVRYGWQVVAGKDCCGECAKVFAAALVQPLAGGVEASRA